MEETNNKNRKTAKILAIIAFISVFVAIPLAVVFDIIAFKDVIFHFIAAIFIPVAAFVLFFIAMLASFILIFGIYLVKEYSFWPLNLSLEFFRQIIGDIKVSAEAIQLFITFRAILIAICVTIIALAAVSKSLMGKEKPLLNEKGKKIKKRNGINGMSTAAIVLGSLGLIVSIGAIVIVASF